jgi:hypothetical protein
LIGVLYFVLIYLSAFKAPARPPEAPGCAMYSLHDPDLRHGA